MALEADRTGLNRTREAHTPFLSSRRRMTTMESLIGLVNRIQRACTVLGDYGGGTGDNAFNSLWEALPTVAVVGGQSSGKSSVLESIVGRDFLPRGSGIVTRRPLVLQLHKTEEGTEEYAEFLHLPKRKFIDFALVRKEIQDETDRITGKSKQISPVPIHLSIFSPNVVNLTLIDLPGLTKVAVEGQPETIVEDIESMVRTYVDKPNCIILAISPANQDIATSDAIKLAKEVDPTGERTFGVLTKLDLMDKGTNALEVLEGRSYKLQHPWVGIVNRSQADINRNADMMLARRKEREYFDTSPDYGHLASKMGSEYLAKLLSKHLESVIRSRIPSILSLINKSIEELERELDRLGRPVAVDAGAQLYTILEMCRAFDKIFKEHLDGGVKRIVSEADGYQPHLIAPEQGYRRLIEGALGYFRGPAEASVDAVHFVLKELVRKSIAETQELKRFPSLQVELALAANTSLEKFREESKKSVIRLVEMESTYLTAEFFRKLPQEMERPAVANSKNQAASPSPAAQDLYGDGHFRRIASNVSAYVSMVSDTLRNTIPKACVYCQVRQAKLALLNYFYSQISKRGKIKDYILKIKCLKSVSDSKLYMLWLQGKQLGLLLDEDPALMGRRVECAQRLELYKKARDEIDAVAWDLSNCCVIHSRISVDFQVIFSVFGVNMHRLIMETPVDAPIKDKHEESPRWKKPTVVFLGGPGSGKGTQCANIVQHFSYTHLSAGDLLRAEIRSGSEVGSMIQSLISQGRIVPSEITVKLLCKAMEESGNDKFIIDGFPRNEENRIIFENVLRAKIKPAFVLFFDCPEEELERRIMNRNQGKEDDNLETIKKRFKVFVESTLPIVSYYESKGKLRKVRTWFFFFSMIVTITCCSTILILIFFLKINAAKPSQEVFEEVKYAQLTYNKSAKWPD
ncbi:hypothetical protein Bca52824_077987 [Brassica carinata]|uniref:adenylate kinase n=1 Tax=Brassica carinata TaxID=52824 RepID=A0A8X7PYA1_BRACI|nr:hypothetical protein Bca52824_077987 [Brassica carinata]